VEVMSMDRKLWDEAKAIAARRSGACADDLAQDLALAAIENGAAAARPAAWLERVGRNTVIDRWRVETRRRELASDIEPPTVPIDPESALLARERRGLVRRALALLPRPQRRAALLRFHGELPFEGVAARLGTPEVTARTRVHRALGSLRAKLGGLRAMFVIPGVQTSALGLALVAAELPAAPPPVAIVGGEAHTTVVRRAAPPARKIAAAPAPAKTAPARAAEPGADATPPPAVQRFDFENDEVVGELQRPPGDGVVAIQKARHSSLIEIRPHFVPEMLKTLEEF
jgi:RNA polymerase sigma-70 factor (ECF subfamily)